MSASSPDPAALREAITSGDPARAMPALAALRDVPDEQAIPLLLLGLDQSTFLVRSLACAGLGVKRSEEGWQALLTVLREDADNNVRAEAANALASYGAERAWEPLRQAFSTNDHWLVRCSILSALAEHPAMVPAWLLELGQAAIADADGTVRVGGAEILGRLVRDDGAAGGRGVAGGEGPEATAARELLAQLQADSDHRVVAAALDGLQA
jgi:hypothetical protein